MSDFNNWSCINRQRKQKKIINNHFHNILRLFDVLPNFSFTTGETMRDYYLETQYIRVAPRVVERLKTCFLGNKKISGKYLNLIE